MDPDLITIIYLIIVIILGSIIVTVFYYITRGHKTRRKEVPEQMYDQEYPIIVKDDAVDINPKNMVVGKQYNFQYHRTWVAVKEDDGAVNLYIVKKKRRWSRK